MTSLTLQDIRPDTILSFAEWCQIVGVGGDQDRVLTLAEWAREASISPRTARELIASGNGPSVVELSPNRLGIRVCDHRAWLAGRTKRKRGGRAAAIGGAHLGRKQWAKRLGSVWRKACDDMIEAVFELGRDLIAAKGELGHGEFGSMFKGKEVPFTWRTANRIMKIANDQRLTNWTRVSNLPPSWGTLYQLTRLEDGTFRVIEPIREHSRKPDCVHERIERLVVGPYLELFARQRRRGWDSWGDEVDKYDAENDFARGIDEAYAEIRARKAAGGKGWRDGEWE